MLPQLRNRAITLKALMIAPDRDLSDGFSAAPYVAEAFEIMADLKAYPSDQTLDIRLRQLDPDVVLLDVASNGDRALAVISYLASRRFGASVVALDRRSDSETVLRMLRAGASEYLYAPFEEASTRDAAARLLRLRGPDSVQQEEAGTVLAFSSVKPGSGASTLALQIAFALRRVSGKRVLLLDLDMTGGSLGFYLRLEMTASVADAVAHADQLTPRLWNSFVTGCDGVDVLPSPAMPVDEAIDLGRLQTVIDYARAAYPWVVIDLPAVLERTTLLTMSQADRTFLVTTSELPSLHLARRAVATLDQLGFPKERCEMIVNRVESGAKMRPAELSKLLACPVQLTLPNDYFSLHRVVTLGKPLGEDGLLGGAIGRLAELTAQTANSLKASSQIAIAPAPGYSV